MTDHHSKNILARSNVIRLNDVPVSQFMNKSVVALRDNFSLKTTIETFRVRHISGAPVVDYDNRVIGVISEYDLLIQAASRSVLTPIEYKTSVLSVNPETTLKEVLIMLYKNKLKWMPVVSEQGYLKGVVTRIDVLHFIAEHSSTDS